MKKSLITFVITSIVFLLGIFAYHYLNNITRGHHSVNGLVQYYEPNLTISADAPRGYYIESSAIGRIYLQDKNINIADYLNKNINARGLLKEICGNDGGSCYPLIEPEFIVLSP